MAREPMTATHAEPAWRDRTNSIVQLDLTVDGMPGDFEQCWTRTEDERHFELCCIPFFSYGQSLGDVLTVDMHTGRHEIHTKSGHRTIRFVFNDDGAAHAEHDALHAALAEAGCLVEFRRAGHYGAIDIDEPDKTDRVISLLTPDHERGLLDWEWADPVSPG